MCKICVFAGTAEGRDLVSLLTDRDVRVTACVATEYGASLLPPSPRLTVSAKRLERAEMEALFARERFDLVADATHPYAPAVTENVAAACEATGTAYLRILRDPSRDAADGVVVPDARAAAEFLAGTEGNVLLTTGSKDLSVFAAIPNAPDRLYARVLPLEDSLAACRNAGLSGPHILAMQGPFSREMNTATLRAVGARWLVTKESGAAGGFEEKAEAARETGAGLVVIGRPDQRPGLPYARAAEEICRRFGLKREAFVTLAGIGPGGAGSATVDVRRAVSEADCLIGAGRMLEFAPAGKPVFEAIAPEAIAAIISEHTEYTRFAVLLAGDTGFFSGAKRLLPLLRDCRTQVLPGVSSLSCLAARLGVSYEDVVPVSLHGRDLDAAAAVRANRRVFFLTGGKNDAAAVLRSLAEAGLGHVRITVGERLSYPDERITAGTAEALQDGVFVPLSVILAENADPEPPFLPGLPDEAFSRGGEDGAAVPMTKSEVRAVSLSKLRPAEDGVLWDVGAGTGSVSVELARLCPRGRVYAVEKKDAALSLLEENRRRFGAGNLEIVPGIAPEACEALPAPTHVFVGGASGNLRGILELALRKNPLVRIVVTAVTLETAAEMTELLKILPLASSETVLLQAARARKAGPYHLMAGQNPVWIFTLSGAAEAP